MRTLILAIAIVGCGGAPFTASEVESGASSGNTAADAAPVSTVAADSGFPGPAIDAQPKVDAEVDAKTGADASAPLTNCNLLAPATPDATHGACAANQRCNLPTSTTSPSYCGGPAGTGTQGTPCTDQINCAAAFECVFRDPGSQAQCHAFCRIGTHDCTQCDPFVPTVWDGDVEIGTCTK